MHRQNKRDVQERKKKQLKFSSFLATTEEKFKIGAAGDGTAMCLLLLI